MSKIVIADSSCLIALSKIGRLNVLQQLFQQILIVPAVFKEVVTLGANRPGAMEVQNANWIEVVEVKDELTVNALKVHLGEGESQTITLAVECSANYIIIDDWQARQTALDMSLTVIGTIAVLKKAFEI